MNFEPIMNDEQKEQARQLNLIGEVDRLHRVNWELQQKLQVAENAQRQSQEQLGLFLVQIGDRGYYVCEAVAKEIEKLNDIRIEFIGMINKLLDERLKLHKALLYVYDSSLGLDPDKITDDIEWVTAEIRAARKALETEK